MDVNQWFLGLPEGRQKVLRDDKWLLAQAAADAATAKEREACAKFLEAQKYRGDHTGLLRNSVKFLSESIRKGDHTRTR